jgi:predicted RNA-binding Zn-ribbon protein involved in translation (DUF1610 family)
MVGLKDITELLDRWPLWKRVKDTPEKVEALEQRVAALEKLLEKAPGDACPKCGAREMRRMEMGRRLGGQNAYRYDTWTCTACGATDEREVHLANL